MLSNSENCFEVLHLIADKVDYFIKCVIKKHMSVPLMTEKLFFLLNLYTCVCENVKERRLQCVVDDESSKKRNTEDMDVSTLWKEKWCDGSAKDKDDGWISHVEENQIVILERMVIQTYERYPLLSMKATSALQGAKQLRSKHES